MPFSNQRGLLFYKGKGLFPLLNGDDGEFFLEGRINEDVQASFTVFRNER